MFGIGIRWRRSLLGANFEISGSKKYILVDPGDGFVMDNGESKKMLRSDRKVWTPQTLLLDPPLFDNFLMASL